MGTDESSYHRNSQGEAGSIGAIPLTRRRLLAGAGTVFAGTLGAQSVLAGSPLVTPVVGRATAPPQACDEPTRSLTLYAKQLGRNRYGYGFTPKTARIPGPPIEMMEGECLAVTLVNRTDRRASLHFHGVDYTVASDGTPLNNSAVRPGRSRRYIISAHAPATRANGTVEPGSAGYYHYHDHAMGTPHGTQGVRSGLFGGLIVRRSGDILPDRKPIVLVMNDLKFNLKSAPNTPTPRANMGQLVEFVVISHGDSFHTFHLHGHRWVDNRTGMPAGEGDPARVIDNKTLGPGDSFGFQIVAGERVGPGPWMYHCHVQGHSDLGMSGIFLVREADGSVSHESREIMRQWRTGHGSPHREH